MEQLKPVWKVNGVDQYDGSSPTLTLSGYLFSLTKKATIDFYVNGLKQTTVYNKTDTEAAKLYPYFNTTTAGFTVELDLTRVTGTFMLKTVVIEEDSVISSQDNFLYRSITEPVFGLYTDLNSLRLTDDYEVSGFYYSLSDNYSIAISVNDVLKGNATIRGTDNEKQQKYSQFKNNEGKFTYLLKKSDFDASKTIQSVSIKYTDTNFSYTKSYSVILPTFPGTVFIESNTKVQDQDSDIFIVKGYYLQDMSGKELISSIGTATPISSNYGLERDDLLELYPTLPHYNVGFDFTYKSSDISSGLSNLIIEAKPIVMARMLSVNLMSDNNPTIANIQIEKNKTQWIDTIKEGDIPSKKIFLREIKTNMASVLTDYQGLGKENESELINKVNSLFTGEVIPSRSDWKIIQEVLTELSTVKELGTAYSRFVQDVSDSLGVSDLYRIRDFIDYIQTLRPRKNTIQSTIETPRMYTMNFLNYSSSDAFKETIDLSFGTTPIPQLNGNIKFSASESEDISYYQLKYSAGNFSEYKKIKPNESKDIWFPLNWQKWFDVSKETVRLQADVQAVDKRGNTSEITSTVKTYNYSEKVPYGPVKYLIEWQLNNGPWNRTGESQKSSFKYSIPVSTYGNLRFRVKAIDGVDGLLTDWIYTDSFFVDTKPIVPFPGIATPIGNPDYFHIDVKWDKASTVDFYEVYIGTNIEVAKKNGQYLKTVGFNHRFDQLLEDTNYTITIRTTNERGSREGSAVIKTLKQIPFPGVNTPKGIPDYEYIDLSWAAGSDAVFYEIYVDDNYEESKRLGRYFKTNSLSGRLLHLNQDTSYKVTLRSTNSRGSREASSWMKTNRRIPVPGKPYPRGTAEYVYADIEWDALSEIDYYEVFVGTDIESAKNKNQYAKTTGVKARISNLNDNTDYTFTVKATNSSGSSQNTVNLRTKRIIPKPLTPVPIASPSYTSAVVTWKALSDVDFYEAYTGTDIEAAKRAGQYVKTVGLNATIHNLLDNHSYTISVKATNVSGFAIGQTNTKTLRIIPLPGKPIVQASTSYLSAFVIWDAVSDADYYEGYVGSSLEASKKLGRYFKTTNLSGVMENLEDDTNYEFRVRATNVTGSNEGSTKNKTWRLIPAPGKPSPTGTGDYKYVDVKWKALPDVEYYEVYNGYKIENAKKDKQYVKTTNTSCRIGNLAEDINNLITVRAVNSSGQNEGSVWIRTKKKLPKQTSFGAIGVKSWQGDYTYRDSNGYHTYWKPKWRNEDVVVQGQWIDYNPVGYKLRGAGTYWSWNDQRWGVNTGYYIVDPKIYNKIKGKKIQSASIQIKRQGSVHGWSSGNPIHWVSHNVTSTSKSGPRQPVFGALVSHVDIDRNGIATINDSNTRTLIQRIADGSAKGFGLYKEYNGALIRMDKAYMKFVSHLIVSIKYFD